MQLRKIFSTLLLTIVLMISVASTDSLLATVNSLTPEAKAYEVNRDIQSIEDQAKLQEEAQGQEQSPSKSSDALKQASQTANGSTKGTFERAADTVREKLNLDEPVPQSTKDFLHGVKGE